MAFGIKLHCWGEWACFTRPEMKVERVSYDVMTPSAARRRRGSYLLEAGDPLAYRPHYSAESDSLHVVRRNEVKDKIGGGAAKAMKDGSGNLAFYVDDGDNRQQRATLMLREVGYIMSKPTLRF